MTEVFQQRIMQLQQSLAALGCDAFLVPTHDCFMSEYPPEPAKRLAWLSGFDGSAGTLLVLRQPAKAILFTDGRYTLQARGQFEGSAVDVIDTAEQTPAQWLLEHCPQAVLGYDGWLHPHQQVQGWGELQTKLLHSNPIDALWHNRPAQPSAPAMEHPLCYAGEASHSKRARLAKALKSGAVLLTQPDGINWLLNVRGGDIAFNPLALCYALLTQGGEVLVISPPREWPAQEGVQYIAWEGFAAAPHEVFARFASLQLDPTTTPECVWQAALAAGCSIISQPDPTALAKVVKNPTEIEGTRAAHRRDGRALTRFLATLLEASAAQTPWDELSAAQQLEQYRRDEAGELYRGGSFETISGIGANGAIVHYRAAAHSNRTISAGELYLVDSGAQYPDGTTDVTRTLVYGTPSGEMIDRYTRVLKGHIAIARAHFPVGTSGGQLDILARQYLWDIGEDYAHGTGHGVGSYLCVHEGPQRISKRGGDVALQAGMILSNEPGYYKAGGYGIRLENLVLVVASKQRDGFLCFETLTLAPFDARLIDDAMLTSAERQWLSAYEQAVLANG